MKTAKMIFAALAVAALALSCTREAEVSDALNAGQEITITATLESGSRTTVQDGGTDVYWEPADEVKIFFDGAGSRFVSNNTELAVVAKFSGTFNAVIGFNEGFPEDNPLWGLYPYRTDATSDGTSVTTTLPAEQIGCAGSFAKNTHITLGRSTGLTMGFYSVCGGLRFSLTQEGIKKVTFEGNNEEALAGTIKMAFEDGVPAILELTEPQTKLTLTAPADGTFQTGVWYYIEAVPGSLSGGYKMTFYKEDESAELSSDSSVSFKRGVFGSLADTDKGLIFKPTGGDDPDPEDIITFADPIAKYACVDKFDTNGDGEVSYAEAAAATTLSGLFTDWNTVTSFEEIKYFTGVTSTANVFNGLTQLDSITIPAQITTLGTFENCTALKKVVLPAALTSLPNYCFSGCNALVDITFPEGLTTIPYNCFRNCSALETIVLPSKVTSIGSYAFSGCSALQRAALPNGIKTLPGDCFSGCGALTEVELPAELTAIPNYCFRNCTSLSSLTIPKSVTSIGNYAFDGCSSLTGLLLPDNLNSIGNCAFQNCTSLTSMALPTGMTALPKGLFGGCAALTTISWPTNLQSIGDYAFNGCYFEENNYTLELPASVTTIGSNAFAGLRHLLIPSASIVSISSEAFGNPAVYYTYLYLPESKVEMYKLRSNWIDYASRIRPMGVYPIETPEWDKGTIGEPVDLGLSVKWASWNVGASTPEQYGFFFSWGETDMESWIMIHHEGTYKWGFIYYYNGGRYFKVTKYGPDNKKVLDLEDDAAAVNWGGSWRMPTKAEQDELRNNCNREWTTLNGINGMKFTSNKEGYTNKWIFLPAAGYQAGTYFYDAGSEGYYWSSTLYSVDEQARFAHIRSGSVFLDSDYRYYGRSVRPVCE